MQISIDAVAGRIFVLFCKVVPEGRIRCGPNSRRTIDQASRVEKFGLEDMLLWADALKPQNVPRFNLKMQELLALGAFLVARCRDTKYSFGRFRRNHVHLSEKVI